MQGTSDAHHKAAGLIEFQRHTPCSREGRVSFFEEIDMSVIAMIVLGLIAGAIAKLIMPGRDPGGMVWTILLGVAGSLVGGFIFNAVGFGDGERWAGLIGSVIGAVILLALYRAFARRNDSVTHRTATH
jgi:uncharacterized membrane protein YeaQ/YmgE (transglycosylase-associated protein family)